MNPIEFMMLVTLFGGDVVRQPASALDCQLTTRFRQISLETGNPMTVMKRGEGHPRIVIDVKCMPLQGAPVS